MEYSLKGFKCAVNTVTDEFDGKPYLIGTREAEFPGLKECALMRLYDQAVSQGRLPEDTLRMVHFVTDRGDNLPIVSDISAALFSFYGRNPGWFPVAESQHMSEVGKFLVSRLPIKEFLSIVFDESFAQAMDVHKWLKIAQIALQPGTIDLGFYEANVFIDSKRPEEDGPILVRPDFWSSIIRPAFHDESRLDNGKYKRYITKFVDIIKVNSANPDLVIKGIFQKANPEHWDELAQRMGVDLRDVDILLCGNSVKYSRGYEIGQIYRLDSSRFAYHSDSSGNRGDWVNVSKQVIQRSFMDSRHFLDQTIPPIIRHVQGLMQYDEEESLRALGVLTKDGEEQTLERAAAVQRRVVEQGLPPSHPANAAIIRDLCMTVIKDRLSKIPVRGFHGMGGLSHLKERGKVGISEGIFNRWVENNGDARAYLFRMPYLGAYGGMEVELYPTQTDSILLHWEDALKMEGDFDGDQYYLIPIALMSGVHSGSKPERPAKGEKATLELADNALVHEMIALTVAKTSIGARDYLLSMGFDYLHKAYHDGDMFAIEDWHSRVAELQIWEQQAIEGIKHSSEGMLTIEEARAFFPSLVPHPYTSLFTNRAWRTYKGKLASTRLTQGYIDKVKEVVNPAEAWHPFHPIFESLSQLEFGEPQDGMAYWKAVEHPKVLLRSNVTTEQFRRWIASCQRLRQGYKDGVNRWDGGKNRNVVFGRDILEPLKADWAKAEALCAGDRDKLHDIHVALAWVAYKPQDNYEYLRIRDAIRPIPLLRESPTIYEVESIKPHDTRGFSDGRVRYEDNEGIVEVRRYLPSSGAIFHHLCDPDICREIFANVEGHIITAAQEDELQAKLAQFLQEHSQ